jgi:predicted HicB family RNase H-like nuclease
MARSPLRRSREDQTTPTRRRGIQQWRAPEGVDVDRLMLRAPRELIDALAEEADSRGVSMNLLVIEWLEDKLRAAGCR